MHFAYLCEQGNPLAVFPSSEHLWWESQCQIH